MDFPIEIGPPRKIIYNLNEYLNFINTHNGRKKAIYRSIYAFKEILNNKPIYNSAIIKCLFFDFDDKTCNAWQECNSLHQHLVKENLKHCMIMSGRGYHLYIFTNPYTANHPKEAIRSAQMKFVDLLKLHVDCQVIGNPAQLARVPNTFNLKGHRFCIPLTQEQFEKGDEYIKQLAKNQNFIKDIFIGDKFLELEQFDKQSSEFDDGTFVYNDIKLEDVFIDISQTPLCIANLLSLKNVGWRGRYILITYFRDKGYLKQETREILKQHLSPEKYKHCVLEENQLDYLYSRLDLDFPSCIKIKQDGFCCGKCKWYNEVIYKK